MFSIKYFLREANIFSVSSTVVLHIIKMCDNCLYVCVPRRQSARQRKKENVIYSILWPYPSSPIDCFCPCSREGHSVHRRTWSSRERKMWLYFTKPPARSPSAEQVCQTFPVTTKHEHAFQVPQARQVLFWQDRVCLPGAICARAECWAVEFF